MSEHTWSQEQIAAFVAGGLSVEEIGRLEAHARDCIDCAAALEQSRRLDWGLGSLFVDARPGVDLEDRTVRALRFSGVLPKTRRSPMTGGVWVKRLAVAASLGAVITVGGVVGSFGDKFPMPNELKYAVLGVFARAGNKEDNIDLRVKSLSGLPKGLEQTPEKDLSNDDPGLQSNLESALPRIERIDKATVDAAVTNDKLGQPNAPDADTFALKLPGIPSGWGETDAKESMVRLGRGASFAESVPTNTTRFKSGDHKSPGSDSVGLQVEAQAPVLFSRSGLSPSTVPKPTDSSPVSNSSAKQEKKDLVNFSMGVFGGPGPGGPADGPSTGDAQKLNGRVPTPPLGPLPLVTGVTIPSPSFPVETAQPPANPPEAGRNIVIRSGEIEFVIDSFDSSAATVVKLVTAIKGAFVSTTNSDKLPNGKVRGSITVRVPPDQLDGLLLDLRRELGKVGELKGSKIGSQDITKQYTDLESRLKAARTMEQRLLAIIKEGKGEIKLLLEAEKELAVWRTKIEEIEGELRYYSNHVSLSTLTIVLTEKDIKASADVTESERVQAGVEVEDVEQTYRQLLAAVAEAKGRVTKSDLKQLAAGQFNAAVHFEVSPDAAGGLRDRLRQLGRVARLEIDRLQQPEGALTKNAKTIRGDTMFLVQLYNIANIAPRETAVFQFAVPNVRSAYESLQETIRKLTGRVLKAQLNEHDQQNVSAQFEFEVRRGDEPAVRSALEALGEKVAGQVSRAAESDNVTDAKVQFRTSLISVTQLKSREHVTLSVEVPDVDQTLTVFSAQATEVKGRLVDSQFSRDRGHFTAKAVYEVPLASASGLVERFKGAGPVKTYQSSRDPLAPEGKYATARIDVTLSSTEQIVSADDSLWSKVREGLSYSVSFLLRTLTWLVFGLCAIVPWVVIGYIVYRLVRWMTRAEPVPVPVSSSPSVSSTPPSA